MDTNGDTNSLEYMFEREHTKIAIFLLSCRDNTSTIQKWFTYIHIQDTYVDESDPCMVTPAVAAFAVRSTYHIIKDKIPVQLMFGRDMILPFRHVVDLEIHASAQAIVDRKIRHPRK